MATISVANFEAITDKIAGAYVAWKNGVGTASPASGTAAYKLGEVRSTILGLDDVDQEIALLSPADSTYKSAMAPTSAITPFKSLILGIRSHVSNISTYCSANGIRVAPEFRDITNSIISGAVLTAYVFTDTVDPIGLWTAGDGTATYTSVANVDTANYSWKANLQIVVTNTIGTSTIAATLTCLSGEAGTTTVEEVVNIPASSAIGATVAVGDTTDMYLGVSDITASGMTNGDAFKVIAIRERPLT